MLDLFKKWDADNSGTVDRTEFRKALRVLKIPGTNAEIDMLFDMWDADGGGSIEYTEILKAVHSGRRFDRLQKRKAGPPLPPLVVCAPANPFESNPRFLEELGLLVRAAASGRPLPKFVPLGKSKTNETLVHSDPSGAPHANGAMLPVGMVWRGAFGDRRVLPLWLGHTPGALFAVSRDAVMEPWRAQRTRPPLPSIAARWWIARFFPPVAWVQPPTQSVAMRLNASGGTSSSTKRRRRRP